MEGTTIKYQPKRGKPTFGYSFFVGRDENGKRIQKLKRGFATKAEAEQALGKAIEAHQKGTDTERTTPTFAAFSERWLNLIFARPDGCHYSPDKVETRVHAAMRKAGLTGVSLHSLRHSHASELLAKGAPIAAVAERLGHASPNITLSIYSHAVPADNEAAARLWDDAMASVITGARKEARKSGMSSNVIKTNRSKIIIPIKSAS